MVKSNVLKKYFIFIFLFVILTLAVKPGIVKAEGINVQLTFSKQSPVKVGDRITVTASAAESNNILYKFWIHDGTSWKIVKDYSTSNTYNWTPDHAAQYRVWVDVKDKNSINSADSHKEIVYDVNSEVKINSITTSLSGLIPRGSPVEIRASSTGGKDPLYRFWIHDGQTWSVLQGYSRSNVATWKPDKTGTNMIWVDVKESTSLYDRDNYKDMSCQITDGAKVTDVTFSKQSPVKVGDAITVTASAAESNNILYKFWIHDGISWKMVKDYSTSNTYNWTPDHAAQYRVWVDVKDKNSINSTDSHKEIVYDVNSEVKINSITTSLSGLIPRGSPVEIRASSTGGKDPLYRFWIHDGQTWSVLQGYSRSNVATWKPDKTGTNMIWVDVKESTSLYDRDNYKDMSCQITDGAKVTDVTFSKQSPVKVGDAITVTVSAAESNNILYKFWIHDGTSWKIVKDYSTSNTYNWTPDHAAQYRVWVDVKDKNSINSADSHKEIVYDVNSIINFTSISTSLSSPQNLGNNILITANYNSNDTLLYRFWIYDGLSWQIVRGYSQEKSYTWIPSKSGNYRIWVDVKSIYSLREVDYSNEIGYTIENKPVIQGIYTNYSSPRRVNSTVSVTANVVYGESNLFRFWIYDGYSWSVVQDYSANNTYIWNPKTEGKYRIWVDVRSARSGVDVEDSKEIYFDIVKYGIINYVNYPNTLDYYVSQQVNYGSPVYSNGVSWLTASAEQVKQYINPNNYINDDRGIYQFLKLTYQEGISVEDLNNILKGKGVLENKGDVFIKAGKLNNINPIYLVSHALLETGNGTSVLATGGQRENNSLPISNTNKPVYGVPVYNMYGVGAYDDSAITSGTTFAYNQKWFTVDDAIIGGASFISNNYINVGRDTLYKMRWNVNNIYKQYATDIRWAYNQTYNIKQLIDQMKNSIFNFEIPIYN